MPGHWRRYRPLGSTGIGGVRSHGKALKVAAPQPIFWKAETGVEYACMS
ncbi:hypothetical protein Thpro_022880 [Acidihalobacter prosperus]|uniref:Uncharacterized protein n=1 Tax=Acidihalobacter prosperus TaxID=160660 RepID=A0A1A6C254_9GAMM|nr:hypothetical protein Thpro_022880 [Acidihalobacter prosperus]